MSDMNEMGDWCWYLGMSDEDDEMCACETREAAIRQGLSDFRGEHCFWIVEARMLVEDEEAMGAGKRDTAPFAETRNGTWITVDEDGQAVEDGE